MFTLHPRLAADSLAIASLPLCQLRLINDCRFTWLILVPQRQEITELHQLTVIDQTQLLRESGEAARLLEAVTAPDKLNVGALGNLVPQFHWHLVARHRQDPCWPGPVWGCGKPEPYDEEQAEALVARLAGMIERGEAREQ